MQLKKSPHALKTKIAMQDTRHPEIAHPRNSRRSDQDEKKPISSRRASKGIRNARSLATRKCFSRN